MALRTFTPPVAPSPGTTSKPEYKILEAEFGDGYTQAGEDGINNVRDVLSLNWETLLPSQAKAIVDFILEHRGNRPFLYTPSNETAARRWTCKEHSDKRGEGGLRQVTATFRRDFNLDG